MGQYLVTTLVLRPRIIFTYPRHLVKVHRLVRRHNDHTRHRTSLGALNMSPVHLAVSWPSYEENEALTKGLRRAAIQRVAL